MDLSSLGAIGIMALVALVLVQLLRPLLQQLTDTQKQSNETFKLLLNRLKESDDVLDRNTAALRDNSTINAQTHDVLKANTTAFAGLQTETQAEITALTKMEKTISDGNSATNERLDTQSEQLTEITKLLRETKNALDGRLERDVATSEKIGRVLTLVEQMTQQDATTPPPPDDARKIESAIDAMRVTDHDARNAAQLTALSDAMDAKRATTTLPQAKDDAA